MIDRYQYIIQFLTMRDSIAIQMALMAALLIAPVEVLAKWPKLQMFYIGLLVVFVYALVAIGVLTDVLS